jgi:hypothetical protein
MAHGYADADADAWMTISLGLERKSMGVFVGIVVDILKYHLNIICHVVDHSM